MHKNNMNVASSLKPGTLTTLLQALVDPALTHFEADDLSHAVLRCLREIMTADNLAILLLTGDHTALRIHTVLGIEELVARDVHIPLGQGFAGQIVTQGVPLIIHDPSPLELINPLLREQLRSLLGVPLVVRQQGIGVLHVGMKREYLFTDEDINVLQRVADSLAQAFERTHQVKVEQDEVGELIDAQLSAVEELIEQQQQASIELLGAQQQTSIELVGTQQQTSIELVRTQQRIAIELVRAQHYRSVAQIGAQLQTAQELVEHQQQTAQELVEHQQQSAQERELVEHQQQSAQERELVEHQQQSAQELVEHQQQSARERELVEHQQQSAQERELVEHQQQSARELVEHQQQSARERELVEHQQQSALELVEYQQQTARERELVEYQQQSAQERELVEHQQQTAQKLVERQQQSAQERELVEHQQQSAQERELVEHQQQSARELVEHQQQSARELIEHQQQMVIELVEAQQQIAVELVEVQQKIAIELIEQQLQIRLKTLERIKELENVFNAITDAIVVFDDQENIIRLNKAANYFLDAEKSSTEQRTIRPLRDEYGHPFSPECLPLKRLLGGERLGAKQAVAAHLHTLDHDDIQISITGTPLYTQQGDLYGAVCVLHDVTKRKHMEQRVEILEVLLQMVELLVKSSAQKEQMSTQDDSAQIIQQQIENTIVALAQRLLGCSHAIIIGIDQRQVLSPLALAGFSTEQEQRLRTALTGALLSLLITDPDTIMLLEKQEVVPFTVTQSPLLASISPLSSSPNCYLAPIRVAHQLIGLLGIVFPEGVFLPDMGGKTVITAISKLCALALLYEQQTLERDLLMTAKILLNEQMQQLNKMQSDFIAVVSHEFRTALTTIEGFSDLLRSEDFSDEEVKNYANDIHTDALRLHRMVTDLLDVEQMKQGKMQMRMGEVDMNALLTLIANRIGPISPHHTLRLSLDETLPHLEGDSDKLIQVITNLLSNAIKYSPMGGEIVIMSRREGNSVHVSIQDQGLGITSKSLENIFTPYHRSNSASTSYIQGTGLGLTLVREILSLHQGTIWVESTLGHGSTFHFSLPLTRETLPLSNEEMKQC